MKNIPPLPEEHVARAAKWEAIGRALFLIVLAVVFFFGLIVYLAQDVLRATAPLLLLFFEAMLVILILILVTVGSYVYFIHKREMHEAELERYRHNTYRFAPTEIGNFEAYYDAELGRFVQPLPGNMQQLVPQNYAPHMSYEYKDSRQGMIAGPDEQDTAFQPNMAPTIEEVVETLPRNGMKLSLGRSLTSGELIEIELLDNLLKLIGATRKGKSCLAAALLEQAQRTHDPNVLQFALLDLEYKTSRLFERSAHVAYIQAGRRGKMPAIARDANEVALWLKYLYQEMDRRYKMPVQQKAQLPYILVYLEEFLDLRRRLKGEVLVEAIDHFTGLATRGLKEKIGLMVCAQVDYSSEELRDAMAQFVGANVAFSVKPSAARSAGFIDNDLLNRNFRDKIPGQFVVEATGLTDLGVSPQFDVKQKLAVLDGTTTGAYEVQDVRTSTALEIGAPLTHPQRTGSADGDLHADAPGWQAHLEQVCVLWVQGYRNQEQLIEKLWHVKKGGNEKWYGYREIVQRCIAEIKRMEVESEKDESEVNE